MYKRQLGKLGELAKTPRANIIKLPNVSASVPQLESTIAELNAKGYAVPAYPREAVADLSESAKAIKARYSKVLGSAVNPVLREGNSDRRVAAPVKAYAQKNPHKMGEWSAASKTAVSSMPAGDFFGSEKTEVMPSAGSLSICFQAPGQARETLKSGVAVEALETVDFAHLSVADLDAFIESELATAAAENVMVSLHLKATMMKVSDPIMFGRVVSVYFKSAFEKHADALASVGANPNNGLGGVLEAIKKLPNAAEVLADFQACYDRADRPKVAMVDSDKGITNLHVPSDVIIDASMPAMMLSLIHI